MAVEVDFFAELRQGKHQRSNYVESRKMTRKQTLSKQDIRKVRTRCRRDRDEKIRQYSITLYHKEAGVGPGVLKTATDRELLKMLVDLWAITDKKFGRSPLGWRFRPRASGDSGNHRGEGLGRSGRR